MAVALGWFAAVGLILFGTLFPFRIDLDAPGVDVAARFAASLARTPRPFDVVGNLLLFVPFGYFGARILPQRWSIRRRWLCVCLAGLAFSLSVESLQAFTVRRVTNAYDVAFNTLSTALGAGWAAWRAAAAARAAAMLSLTPVAASPPTPSVVHVP